MYKDIINNYLENHTKSASKKWLKKMYNIFNSLDNPDYADKLILLELSNVIYKLS